MSQKSIDRDYLTDMQGNNVTCHECGAFIVKGDEIGIWDYQHNFEFPKYHYHRNCYIGVEETKKQV